MTNLTPGTKVIYFKSYSFDPAPARVGYIAALWPEDAVIVATTDDLALWPRCPMCMCQSAAVTYTAMRCGALGYSGSRTLSSCRSNTVSWLAAMCRRSY
jgi:hypothetical protein